jgi:flagellar basal body-associated protein FliL
VFFHDNPPGHEQIDVLPEIGEIGGQTFTGIGRIRISTTDLQPGMVILFVSFIYYPEDKVFSEELVLKIRDFREIIIDYIGSFSVEDLQKQEEESIKLELLRRFNAVLRLGQIETLFFSDFMIIG